MLSERQRCQFRRLWVSYFFIRSFLFPEYWYWSTDHNKAHDRVTRLDNLFGFNKISGIAEVIEATIIKSCPASLYATSRYQCDLEVSSLDLSCLYPDIPLDYWREPFDINFLVYQVLVHLHIPEVVLITCYHSHLPSIFTVCLRLRFQEFDPVLAGGSQVVPIGKVVSLSQIAFNFLQEWSRSNFGLLWECLRSKLLSFVILLH